MTRKLKLAGALVAVVAIFALIASSASATFTSANYPATASGSSTSDKFDLFGSSATCTSNTFTSASLAKPGSTTLTVTPVYSSCTAFGLPATVFMTGCDYLLHSAAGATNMTVDLVCPAGVKGVDIIVYTNEAHLTPICHVTAVTPFAGKTGLRAHNSGIHIDVTGTVEGIVAHQSRTNFLCPAGTETKEAKYTVQAAGITMKGNSGSFFVS